MQPSTLATLLILAPATLAHAQIGTGSWWWEASANGGATWTRGTLEVQQATPSVLVRARASWSSDAGPWFARANFDAVIETNGQGDDATDFRQLTEASPTAPIVASRFGSLIKIDDERDTLPPGLGTRAIAPGQFVPAMGNATTANPIALFRFELNLDGTTGERRITEAFRQPTTGGIDNTTDRVFRIYTTAGGLFNVPLIQREALTIRVIPSPAAALPLCGVVFLTRCRRRVPTREAPPCSRERSPHY